MTLHRFGVWQVAVSDLRSAPTNFMLAAQQHGGTTLRVSQWQAERLPADGLVTSAARLPLAVITADCVPFVLMTASHAAIIHVSRSSLICDQLEGLPQVFPVADIIAVFIGPHICATHLTYEHAAPSLAHFIQKYPHASTQGATIHISLRRALQTHLDQWRVRPELVHEDTRCTYEDATLYSYRRWCEQHHSAPFPELITIAWKD